MGFFCCSLVLLVCPDLVASEKGIVKTIRVQSTLRARHHINASRIECQRGVFQRGIAVLTKKNNSQLGSTLSLPLFLITMHNVPYIYPVVGDEMSC